MSSRRASNSKAACPNLETEPWLASQMLHAAARDRKLGECKRLLDAGVPVNSFGGKDCFGSDETALSVAATHGHLDVVTLLLENEASVDKADECGHTPLFWAAYVGNTAVMTLLLEKGASVDKASDNGNTPLLYAAMNGRTAVVTLLLEKDTSDEAALYLAAEKGHIACVQALLVATLPKGVAGEMRRHFA